MLKKEGKWKKRRERVKDKVIIKIIERRKKSETRRSVEHWTRMLMALG